MKKVLLALFAIVAPAAVYIGATDQIPSQLAFCCVEDPPCPWVVCAATRDQQPSR
jgi:hypothetical protein